MPGQATNTIPEVLKYIDQMVRWVTPLLVAITSLVIFIYRSKIKDLERRIQEESEERKKDIDCAMAAIKSTEEEIKDSQDELIKYFKEGIRDEREYRTGVMLKQSENIEEIFRSIKELSGEFNRVDQKLESHIENQEKICKLYHA